MARILLVYPNLTHQETISMGLSSIVAYIKQQGHKTELMDFTWTRSFQECLKKIENFQPQAIGFSIRSGEYHFCLDLAKTIKKEYKDVIIIFGGVHPTIEPEEVISADPVDIVCIGEGEYSLNELLNRIEQGKDFSDVEGLWVKKGDKIT